jgi:hypothetical protein
MTETPVEQRTIGIDMFIHSAEHSLTLGPVLEALVKDSGFILKMIANRGVQVYPDIGGLAGEVSPHHQCRFVSTSKEDVSEEKLVSLLQTISKAYRWVHTERLYVMDNKSSYTKVQGED